MPEFRNRIESLEHKLLLALPGRLGTAVRGLAKADLLESKTRDVEIWCSQLQATIKQMGGFIPPPPHLQVRVAGAYTAEFIEHGNVLRHYLELALTRATGRELASFSSVLDFGCGCARVLRAIREQSKPTQQLYGTDIDAEAIEWCRANYSTMAEFGINDTMPPLEYADATFDLVFSVSIFTHLPEDMQFAWLKELQRVTMPGGYLLLTTHNKKYFEQVPQESRAAALEKGFYYRRGVKTAGLPEFYQTTFHTPEYVRANWSEFFEVIEICERAVDDHQDIVVCRRR